LKFTQIARGLDLVRASESLARAVSHLAREYGIGPRQPVDGLITAEWIHQCYVVDRRTLTEMADEIGVHASTIRNWARKLGIQVHTPKPPPHPRITGLLEALSLEPGEVPAGMRTPAAWARVQRFAAAARYDSFSRAAEALGFNKSSLCAQIRRLEADFGQALVERAASSRHPMRLTEFGKDLAYVSSRTAGG
jgi:Bacterial regulatory helix-turn-helix protein, lysR family